MRTGELTEEDHDIGVDDGAASTGHGDEVEPSEAAGTGLGGFEFIEYGVLHDEEFFAVLSELRSTDTLPDVECFKGTAFVHEEAGRFGHEEHANQHDGGEDKGRAEHVTPAAALLRSLTSGVFLRARSAYPNVDEYCSHHVAEDLTQSDIELIQRDQVSSVLPGHRFGHVDGHSSTFKANTKT